MRELKFRAWDIERKTYEHEELLLAPNGDILASRWQELCEPESEYIIEQYTGLKDKNDKEIYEGDIVRIVSESFLEPSVGIVGFDEDKGIYDTYITENNKVYWEAGSCLCSLIGREDYTTEVIGNIHENPELLEHKG